MFITFKDENEYEIAKAEFNQLLGFLKGTNNLDGFKMFYDITSQLNHEKEITMATKTELASGIDNRMVHCSCGKKDCKVGLNFDEGVMLLTNKYGNETAMQLNKENIDEIISQLKQMKKSLK